FERATSTFARASDDDRAPALPAPRARFRFDRVVDASGVVRFVASGGVGDDHTYAVWRVGDEAWSTGELLRERREHASTVLPDGRVLILGGAAPDGRALSSTEVIDPIATEQAARAAALTNGAVTTVRSAPAQPLRSPRRRPLVADLRPGVAVVVGGLDDDGRVVDVVESFTTRPINDAPLVPVDTVGAVGCEPLRVSRDGRRVLDRCNAITMPGIIDDDPLTPELLLHDVEGGTPRCISCRLGHALGVAGATAVANEDLSTVVFTSAAAFADGDDGAVDLFTWRAGTVTRTLPLDAPILDDGRPLDVLFDGDGVFVVAYFARGGGFVFGRPAQLAVTTFDARSLQLGFNGGRDADDARLVVGVADQDIGQGVNNAFLNVTVGADRSALGFSPGFGQAPTTAPRMSANAAFAVAGSVGGALEVYAAEVGYQSTTRTCRGGCGAPIMVADDGTILASGDADGPLVSTPEGTTVFLRSLAGDIALETLRQVALANDGRHLAFATDEGVWRVRFRDGAPQIPGCSHEETPVGASDAVIDDDGTIWLGDIGNELRSAPLVAPQAPIVVVAADVDAPRRTWANLRVGSGLVVGFDGSEVLNVLQTGTGEVIDLDVNVLRDVSGLTIRDVAILKADRIDVVVDDGNGTVIYGIDLVERDVVSELRAGSGRVSVQRFDDVSRAVATPTTYQLLAIADDGELVRGTHQQIDTEPVGMRVSVDGTVWLVRRRTNGAEGVQIDRYVPGQSIPETTAMPQVFGAVDLELLGNLLVIATADGTLHRFDLTSSTPALLPT
ncbi:MAG TPA: kelch repeat-containing protein, partial [Myxococcota bacterium]